jgi:hypothetical protein
MCSVYISAKTPKFLQKFPLIFLTGCRNLAGYYFKSGHESFYWHMLSTLHALSSQSFNSIHFEGLQTLIQIKFPCNFMTPDVCVSKAESCTFQQFGDTFCVKSFGCICLIKVFCSPYNKLRLCGTFEDMYVCIRVYDNSKRLLTMK